MYFLHGRYRYVLNPKERKELDAYLREPCKGDRYITNWQWLVRTWNVCNPDDMLDYDEIKNSQPDYRYIERNR